MNPLALSVPALAVYLLVGLFLLHLHQSWERGEKPPFMAYVVAFTWPVSIVPILRHRHHVRSGTEEGEK